MLVLAINSQCHRHKRYMRIKLTELKAKTSARPDNYYQDVISAGSIDGEYLTITPKAYYTLLRKYNPRAIIMNGEGCCGDKSYPWRVTTKPLIQPTATDTGIKGLGSLIEKVALPIAKTIDKVTGGRTNVAGCQRCKKTKGNLDQRFPFNN